MFRVTTERDMLIVISILQCNNTITGCFSRIERKLRPGLYFYPGYPTTPQSDGLKYSGLESAVVLSEVEVTTRPLKI